MKVLKVSITLLMAAFWFTGCASNDSYSKYEKYDSDSFVTEFYAWVDNVETVRFDSDVGENVLIGATHGAISGVHFDRHHALRGAIIGGFLAGLVTAIVEGTNKGYEYELSAIDGDSVIVLSERHSAELGDCVVVRVANSVRIRPVRAERCAL